MQEHITSDQLPTLLLDWRTAFDKHFSRSKLKGDIPSDGPFQHDAPPILRQPAHLDSPPPAYPQHRDQAQQPERRQRRRRRDRELDDRDAGGHHRHRQDFRDNDRREVNDRDRNRRDIDRRENDQRDNRRPQRGIIPGETIARQCLIAKVSRDPPTIIDLLRSIPVDAPSIPEVPQPDNPQRGQQICLSYMTHGGNGCHRRSYCRFAHLDLSDAGTRRLTPHFFRSLQRVLSHPAIRPHFKMTGPFVQFCSELPPRE